MTEHRGCSVPRTDPLADGCHQFPCTRLGEVVTAHARGTKPSVSGNTTREPPGVAVQVISCNFNGGLKTTEPSPFEISEILLLNLDSNIIQERRMHSFIKVKVF